MAELSNGEANLEESTESPWSATETAAASLITQMRTYDVLMALLDHFDSKTADMLYEAHSKGKIVTSLPAFMPESGNDDS